MRVLFCGDRAWEDSKPIVTIMRGLKVQATLRDDDLVIIEGEARGADALARNVANALRVRVEPYPAQWETHGKAAGPIRNQQMLDVGCPQLVYAFHDFILNSRGTKDMCLRAAKAGLPVYVVSRFRANTLP